MLNLQISAGSLLSVTLFTPYVLASKSVLNLENYEEDSSVERFEAAVSVVNGTDPSVFNIKPEKVSEFDKLCARIREWYSKQNVDPLHNPDSVWPERDSKGNIMGDWDHAAFEEEERKRKAQEKRDGFPQGTLISAKGFAGAYLDSGKRKCLDKIMNKKFRKSKKLRKLVNKYVEELEHALYFESATKFGEGTYKGFCLAFGEMKVRKFDGGYAFLKPNQVIRKGDIVPYKSITDLKVTNIKGNRKKSIITLEDAKDAQTVLTLSIAELANVIYNNADIPGFKPNHDGDWNYIHYLSNCSNI